MVKRPLNPLFDPRTGEEAIRVHDLHLKAKPFEPARTNCFSVYLIETGSGSFWADASQFEFQPNCLLFFVPYQYIRFEPEESVTGQVIQFHANFLCVETFHAESGCSGVLFNDPFGVPWVTLDSESKTSIAGLIERLKTEQVEQNLAYTEVMLAHLKVLLILATRIKSSLAGACGSGVEHRHPLLAELRDLIEHNYRAMHSPADYARRLHVTPKTLGRIVREHLGTTPSELIRNRILMHAKWQILHTLKPVKEVSRELGFSDELYFSRLFKKATGYSPTFFREYETEIRGGSNLSMLSSETPIPKSDATAQT
ncbi:helix-turn-helix domain-containing protein [Lacunimicrobium album]